MCEIVYFYLFLGVKALKEIRFFQNQCLPTIPRAPIRRLIREITAYIAKTEEMRYTVGALEAIQVSHCITSMCK